MTIALIVGVDYYDNFSLLGGCANDASSVAELLGYHENNDKNFDCNVMLGTRVSGGVNKNRLKDNLTWLFSTKTKTVLFYFAGHGNIESTGGYLMASDSTRGDDGVSLDDVITLANQSPAQNKIIILDCCHSGAAGSSTQNRSLSVLNEGLTVMTATSEHQLAMEENGKGIFTALLIDALKGGAASLTGDISPGAVYAYIDQSLSLWKQRPLFKTNVTNFVCLRKVTPPISTNDLKRIREFFTYPGFIYPLNPTYEPEMSGRSKDAALPIAEKVAIFGLLQKYNRLNLVVPVDAPHMWHAAMESKACKLTELGEHYRRLAEQERI